MRKDRPSTTASAVALARAVASLPARRPAPAIDLLAKTLLRPPLGAILRGLEPLSARTDAVGLALRVASAGLVDHMALRTAAIDQALGEALAQGPRQLVVLGAGLDSRAVRLPGLDDVVVFELDHPATQRFKRSRVEHLAPRAKEVRFVPVDFERERLDVRLADEGHDADAPTLWVWEGVTPYLEPSVTRESLQRMAARSAPASRLAVTYGTMNDRLWMSRLARPVHLAFRFLGEPLRGLLGPEELHALLHETGWSPLSDSGPRDWRARYGWGIEALLTIDERLVVAERVPAR